MLRTTVTCKDGTVSEGTACGFITLGGELHFHLDLLDGSYESFTLDEMKTIHIDLEDA